MAKAKKDIERDDLSNSMLRKVIVRADFTPMLDLEAVVSDINRQEWFMGNFNNYEKKLLTIRRESPRDNEYSLDGEVIKRFSDCNVEPERNVTLDIGSNVIVMEIKCDEDYDKIDKYLNLFVRTLEHIIVIDGYVKLERIAIRKTDGMESIDGGKADEVFEYFDQQIGDTGDKFTYRTYTDSFINGEFEVFVNYNRTVRVISGDPTMFIFVLDIDTYLDRDNIANRRPNTEELWGLFYERLNKASFELFKRGVKESYLNSILKEQ